MRRVLGVLIAVAALIAIAGFPRDTDAPLTAAEIEQNRRYYATAYQKPDPTAEADTRYVAIAEAAAEKAKVRELVSDFVTRYELASRPVLEIGSGRGNLQDVAGNYTGLDISPSVARFYHRPFVVGSATALPFNDSSFDGGWSIWVLEHVPNPEQALSEIRRVMRPGAVFYLMPAWSCDRFAADGYHVRPYSDFGAAGKVVKASARVADTAAFKALERIPTRFVRRLASWVQSPLTLHYKRITPNEHQYWEPDSDAINSLDRHEVMLWFTSRGDECLNCSGRNGTVLMAGDALVIRVRK